MFDIDKMYLMMPTFNVGLNNQDVNTFKSTLRDTLRGDTVKESISNFRSLYEQLSESEVISEEELEEFENTFFTSDEIKSELKGAEKKVFDFMLSGNNIENPIIQDIFDQLGVSVNKNLKYVDKPHMKGYHENRLIALYKSVLTHPEIISSVMLPIDFSYLKTDAVDLTNGFSGDTNVPFYHVSPIEDIQLMYDFRNGKAGVGQEANWMVDISRRGRLTLNNFRTSWFNRNAEEVSGNELGDLSSIPSGVIRLDRQNYYNLPSKDLNEYREDMYNSFRADGMTHTEAELKVNNLIDEITDLKIGDGMTAILNAFVDIAKDPFITRANWVTTTTNPANFLLRLGLHPLYVNAFMAQPILRDYTNRINTIRPKKGMTREDTFLQLIAGEHLTSVFESESAPVDVSLLGGLDVGLLYFNRAPDTQINYDVDIYGLPISDVNKTVFRPGNILSLLKVTKADPEYEAKREQATKLGEYLVNFHNSNYDTNSDVNIESLSLRELRNQVKSSNFDFNIQKSALLKFFEYRNVTTVLKDVMTVSKTDTDGVGDNILNMIAYNNIARGILDTGNNTSYSGPKIMGFESRFNKTPLGAYYRNLVAVFNTVKQNPELFNGANEHNINMINLVSTQLSGENIKDTELIRDIDNALYHSMMDSFFNLTASEKADLIKNTPARLLELKKSNPDNLFVRALTVETANVVAAGNVNKIVTLSNLKRSPYEQDLLSSEWNRLFEENPELAEDLVKYSFVMSGFNITNGQFFTLIPHQYLLKKDINKHVRTYKASSDFIDRFIANNLDNTNVTKHIGNFIRKPDMKGSEILSYTFMDNEVQKNYIKHGSRIYKKAYQEKGFSNTFVYVPIERTGIKVGKNVIPEYGNTISSLIRTDKQRLLHDERMAKLDSILNTHSIVEVYQNTTFVDNIFDSNQFTERFRPDSVEVRSNNYLKSQAVFMTRDQFINTNSTTSEGANNIFSNIFTGTEEKGKISLNRNNIPLRSIKSTLVNGFGDIVPVISNMEYAAKAYINWLTKGDNQHIPADKIQQYDELRETILNEVHNPESQLNQALNEGYKFVSPNDMLGGLKYTTHTDLLAQYMADFRQKRDYPMVETTGQPVIEAQQQGSANMQNYSYAVLGDKTQSNFSGVEGAGVQIVSNPNTHLAEQQRGEAVVAYRNSRNPIESFGNPFTDTVNRTTKQNVDDFVEWVIEGKEASDFRDSAPKVEAVFLPGASSGSFRVVINGDKYKVLATFDGDRWGIFPQQEDGTFSASDPETKNPLILAKEKSRELVSKYVPDEMLNEIERGMSKEVSSSVKKQDDYRENSPVSKAYKLESLEEDLTVLEGQIEIYKSKGYIDLRGEESAQRVLTRALEHKRKLEEEIKSEKQNRWIIEQLQSGKFKGKPIYYGDTRAAKKTVPSHATSLDWLINSPESPFNNSKTTEPITDIYGNQYSSDTNITTYESEVGPIRYVTNEEGDLVMLREGTSISNKQPIQQQKQQESGLSKKENYQKLATFNKGRSVSVKYDKYKTPFNAIITGEIEEFSTPTELRYDDGRIAYKDDGVYRIQIKSSTGKILSADTSEITGLINPEITPEQNQQAQQSNRDMSTFTNHSGGAKGGDTYWDSIGREFGVQNHNHYRPNDYTNASNRQQLNEQYLETVRFLGRGVISEESYAGKLVRRDMIQANNADSIIGITELIAPGVKGRKGYNNKKNHIIPEGGTGYAVSRGILSNKPTYVYNQSSNYGVEQGWYKWENNDFIKTEAPVLTNNFAGIGSQEINEFGINAIREVYEKTASTQISPQQQVQQTNRQQQVQTSLFDNMSATESEINNLVDDAIKKAIKSSGNGSQMIHQLTQFKSEALSAGLTVEEVNDYIKKCLN